MKTSSNPFKIEVAVAWTPPYPVPKDPGEVVKIAGDASGGSTYPTNVWADVRPNEVGGAGYGNQMLTTGDSACTFIASYSRGGCIAIAGSGGHKGTPIFGAGLFDFEDATWKRVWTGGTTTDKLDVRSDTRVHNLLNYEDDLHDIFGHDDWDSSCWYPPHWPSSGDTYVPRTADPRDQTWEITRPEPAPYDASGSGKALHGWPYPGEWAGAQDAVTGLVNRGGFVGKSTRFDPTPGKPVPAPGHCWDMYFEITPAQGGGPKGSIAFMRSTYMGHASSIAQMWSHRFDLDSGEWIAFSVNSSAPPEGPDAPPGGAPWHLHGSTAGATDPLMQRVYLLDQHMGGSNASRVNYMNLSDRTWRNLHTGANTPAGGRTEALSVDFDRRLLIMVAGEAPYLRAFDLTTVGPEPVPATGTGGFRALEVVTAPGFTPFDGASSFNFPWRFYPPNGKLYRCFPKLLPKAVDINGDDTSDAYYADPANLTFATLQRLTPPPVGADYFSEPWTYDEITLSAPLPRPSYGSQYSSVSNKWFHYVPALQCFAWCPLDHGNGEPATRHCVYLIKPY